MSKTVVGLFQSTTEAQKVKHELVNQGYSAGNINVMANEDSTGGAGSSTSSAASNEPGFGATISNFFKSLTGGGDDEQHYAEGVRKGGAMLSVTVQDGQEDKVADLLERHGAQDVNDQQAGMQAAAGVGAGNTARPIASNTAPVAAREVSGNTTVPIVQEDIAVGKRQVQRGGVRVYSHMVETPVEENIQLRDERVYVDRQKVDRPATEADFTAFKEGSMELTETAEEAVVSKKARIVEEVTLGKQSSESTQTIRDTVRHTEVETEQLPGSQTRASASPVDNDFRTHYQTNYASTGNAYESYAPAYQYGQTLANDPRYKSGNWSSVEAGARQDWASKGTGKWEDFKGAVQQGWNKVRESTTAKTNS